MMPIDPSFAVSGAEWQIAARSRPRRRPPAAPTRASVRMLGDSIQSLAKTQTDAAEAVAGAGHRPGDRPDRRRHGRRARPARRCSSRRQIRTKAVEAAQDIFHTQV